MQSKLMDWFLHDSDLRQERVKQHVTYLENSKGEIDQARNLQTTTSFKNTINIFHKNEQFNQKELKAVVNQFFDE